MTVTFPGVPVERGELAIIGTKGSQTVKRRVVMAGEVAKLTLTTSHATIDAERGAVALLTTDAVDSAGNPVQEFTRDLHWSVTGPATLVTPDTYTSDLKKNQRTTGSFYIVAPVCTLIRSTGRPGEIVVTVRADGIPPASMKIAANPVSPVPGFVTEPPVAPGNRQPVAVAPDGAGENAGESAAALDASERSLAMKPSAQDLTLATGKDAAFYKTEVTKWFTEHDPSAVKRPAFDELTRAFVEHLAANGGLLVADDFNQRAQQFNDVCTLEDAAAARKLPTPYVVGLAHSYARRAIHEGETLQLARELRWIAALPPATDAPVLEKATTPSALFDAWYPDAKTLTPGQREAAFKRFESVNAPFASEGNKTAKRKPPVVYPAKVSPLRPSLQQLLEKQPTP